MATITIPQSKLKNGSLRTALAVSVRVSNAAGDTLVVNKTGLTTNATTAVIAFDDVALVIGTQYECVTTYPDATKSIVQVVAT